MKPPPGHRKILGVKPCCSTMARPIVAHRASPADNDIPLEFRLDFPSCCCAERRLRRRAALHRI